MTDLLELAERCEKAAGWDVELDKLIWFALGPDKEAMWSCSGLNAQRWHWKEADLLKAFLSDPAPYGFTKRFHEYTGSIDAATRLVPKGWCMDCGTGGGGYVYGPWCRVYPDRIAGQSDGTGNRNASTMPLAICAAALRSRAGGAGPLSRDNLTTKGEAP
ncbi:hypothetical protein [Tardiphaga sp.]|uniref:hypothetical protein n=1 Tax=Tardiphaga sp. TaxID=1926292 RepID=UPI002604C5EE|nr:hypothetical protein [Tardiphaga sp.]MDB5616050.1 hypothetical protein [Tardiphaga sp.]